MLAGNLRQHRHAVLMFALCLLAGLLTFHNYGSSWDEGTIGLYANESLAAYSTWWEKGTMEFEHANLVHYGPFFMMLVEGAVNLFGGTPEQAVNLRHLMYFLVYFAGGGAFYVLALRWFDKVSALGAALLYLLQPVLWGHAFINPKDTPFLSLVVIAAAAGFKMADVVRNLPADSHSAPIDRRAAVLSLLWLVTVFALYLLTEPVRDWIVSLVTVAKGGGENIISFIATKLDSVPAQVYVQRYFLLYLRVRFVYLLVGTAVLLVVWYRRQPQWMGLLSVVWLPALLLGMASATRVLGPFVGVMVAFELLRARTKAAVVATLMYAVVAMMFVHGAWPHLWMDPLGNYFGSLRMMSNFPLWEGRVLFDGNLYAADELPISYLPVLLGIQLTEPVWILAVLGLFFSFRGAQKQYGLTALFIVWFMLPLLVLMIRNSILYDNFRHILFLLPPVFLLAGAFFAGIANLRLRIAVIAAAILPGLVGIISMQPYEYAYYNQFIGGVKGAEGRFELDYWLTSYREAADYVNENASTNAAVWVQGPGRLFAPFARPDLTVNSWSSNTPVDGYEFAVVSTRLEENETSYPDAAIVHRIERGGAVFTFIKKP